MDSEGSSSNPNPPSNGQLSSEQLISNEIRLIYNAQRQKWSTKHVLTDVNIVFNESKLAAHKFILLDGPIYPYFREKLQNQRGLAIIDIVQPTITAESVDKILSYIYGMPIPELGINQENVEAFLDAAVYFKMDILLLSQLLIYFNPRDLGSFVLKNIEILFKNADFWKLKNEIILELCHEVSKERIEDAFLDWIHENKPQRKQYLPKLTEFGQLITIPPSPPIIDSTPSNPITSMVPLTVPPGNRNMESFGPESTSSNSISTTTNRINQSSSIIHSTNVFDAQEQELEQSRSSSSGAGPVEPILRRSKRQNICIRNVRTTNSSWSSDPGEFSNTFDSDSDYDCQKELSGTIVTRKRPGKASSGKRNKRPKLIINGQDLFHSIREGLTRNICNNAFLESWRALSLNTRMDDRNKEKDSIIKNRKKFIDQGGLKLLIESTKAFPNQVRLTEILLDTILNFTEHEESRALVFTDEVVEYLFEKLQRYDFMKTSIMAGESLVYLLQTYRMENWTLKIRRWKLVLILQSAISKHWNLDFDRTTYFSNQEQFTGLIDLIKSSDDTVNLFALWSLTYYTKTDTSEEVRNDEALVYISWLLEANCEASLERFIHQTSNRNLSKFAKILLDLISCNNI